MPSASQRAKSSTTIIQKLQHALGKKVSLLDEIPLDKVEIVRYGLRLTGFLPIGIHLATVEHDCGTTETVYALMRDSAPPESLPEIWTYARELGEA